MLNRLGIGLTIALTIAISVALFGGDLWTTAYIITMVFWPTVIVAICEIYRMALSGLRPTGKPSL